MKILSWNIWVDGDFEGFKRFVSAADADIIGLQEVKDDDPGRDVIGYLENLGYRYAFARTEQIWDGKVYRHGPAVFSRLPVIDFATYLLDEEDERAVARVDVDLDGTTVHIFSTHLIHTHQKPSAQQEAQATKLIGLLPSEHTVVMGDFNATPDSKAITMMKEVLTDTDPSSTPTWSTHIEGCTICKLQVVNTRLDYIFISRDLKAHSFEVGQSEASDHLPISVVVEI